MRDLSKFTPVNRSRPQVSRKLLAIVLSVVILTGLLFFAKSRLNTSGSSASDNLHDAPLGLTPVQLSNNIQLTSEGTDLTTQSAVLKDVKYGGEASGTASRSFGGGLYILSVDINIPDPVNVSVGVWLTAGGKSRFIDYMKGNGNRWSLTLRDTDKYSGYSSILVTLERTKEDNKPEEHVLEGTFKL